MATTKRLKSREAVHKDGRKCQQKNTRSRQDYLVPRAEKPWDGVAVILENTQEHAVSVDYAGYFQRVERLGTVDPSLQCKDRIFFLTCKYWSILNPHSFRKAMVYETITEEGEEVRIEGQVPELNSHRYAPSQEGLMPMGHPLNAPGPAILDDEGQPTGRYSEHAIQNWGPVYPAIFKDTVKVPITKKIRITIPDQAVQEFKAAMLKDQAPMKRGRQPVRLLKEATEILARYKVPLTYQVVSSLVMMANEGKPVSQRTAYNAFAALGLVRLGTIEGLSISYYGYPDGSMVDRRTITIGHPRIEGSGCPLAQVDAREVLAKSRRRKQVQDRSWLPFVQITDKVPRKKKNRAKCSV